MIVHPGGLVILLFHLARSEDCVIDNRTPNVAWEQKLRKDLISCADRNRAPDSNNTTVSVKFILKSFKFMDGEEIFSINSWLFVAWHDPRLEWNPGDYGGVAEALLWSHNIWSPSMKHYTGHDYDDLEYFNSMCRVAGTGHVACVARVVLQSVCSSKLRDWPHDTQNCTFKFGARSPIDNLTITYNSSRAVSMLGAEYGPGWNIIDYSNGRNPKSTVQFYFSFILERQGAGLAAIIIVPSLVLSGLTVLAMSLNVEDRVRLGVLCFGLLNQFLFLQEISSDIPKHSADSPTVLIYLRTSVVLTSLAIGLTLLLSHLRRRTVPPPNYVVALCEWFLEPYGKYFIWPRWSVGIAYQNYEEVASEISSVWVDFASIVNFVSMLIITIIYITTFSIYIPQQQPEF